MKINDFRNLGFVHLSEGIKGMLARTYNIFREAQFLLNLLKKL